MNVFWRKRGGGTFKKPTRTPPLQRSRRAVRGASRGARKCSRTGLGRLEWFMPNLLPPLASLFNRTNRLQAARGPNKPVPGSSVTRCASRLRATRACRGHQALVVHNSPRGRWAAVHHHTTQSLSSHFVRGSGSDQAWDKWSNILEIRGAAEPSNQQVRSICEGWSAGSACQAVLQSDCLHALLGYFFVTLSANVFCSSEPLGD